MKKLLIYFSTIFLVVSCTNSNETAKENNAKNNNEAKTQVEESTPKIVTKEISYEANGTTMQGFMAKPGNIKENTPGVLVVHEWWGHNEHARNKAKALAELGYVAFAVDMYGNGKQASHPEDAGKFAGMVMQNIDEAQQRFNAAYSELTKVEGVNAEKIAAIGFCFGGSVVMTMANMGVDLKAVTAFHTGVAIPVMPEKGKLNTPILVCNGADDPFVKPEQKTTFKEAMDATGVDYKFLDYPGVVHAFTNPGADTMGQKFNLPLAYNQKADEKSWNEMKAFFEKHLN